MILLGIAKPLHHLHMRTPCQSKSWKGLCSRIWDVEYSALSRLLYPMSIGQRLRGIQRGAVAPLRPAIEFLQRLPYNHQRLLRTYEHGGQSTGKHRSEPRATVVRWRISRQAF